MMSNLLDFNLRYDRSPGDFFRAAATDVRISMGPGDDTAKGGNGSVWVDGGGDGPFAALA